MPRLDRDSLKRVTVHVGEKNYYERQSLREMFLAQGVKSVNCHATLDAIRTVLTEAPPDMLVLTDDFDPAVYDLVREIRHQKVGENPFMLITLLVDSGHRRALPLAIDAGVDDIVIKPLSPELVRERMALVAFHRPPFVASGEYLGPERRNDPQRVATKRIAVLNTLLEKVNGNDYTKDSLRAAIEGSLQKVLQAQLDSQSSRLGEVCDRIVRAYDSDIISDMLQGDLLTLSGVLVEAASVALRLKDAKLSKLCTSLSENVTKLADHYDHPRADELDLVRKITAAFQMASERTGATNTKDTDGIDLAAFAGP
jgi:response regulator RpfG family c-di-GMP phosphodiesterase